MKNSIRGKKLTFFWMGIDHVTRVRYWSSSSLANYLKRKADIEIPYALTWEAWDEYYKNFKEKAPITFFITESLLPSLQNIIYLPLDIIHTINNYYSNAIKHKVHYLDTKLPRGKWYDTDFRLLCASMNALVDFVEIEWAWSYLLWHEDEKDFRADFYHYNRSPNAAKKYVENILNEEYSFPDWYDAEKMHSDVIVEERQQHDKYKETIGEIYEIYTWWKTYFPTIMSGESDNEREIEDKYLKRLIELRHHLWT